MQFQKEKTGRRGFPLFGLLILLMAVFMATSGLLGFQLGKSAVHGTGELIDTIVLSPEQSLAGGGDEITHFLSGRLLYPDGSPCTGVTVCVKDSPLSDETNERGKFFFSGVTTGDHTLEVLDKEGELLADAAVSLWFQKSGKACIDITVSKGTSVEMPDDTRMLELTLTMDAEDGSLTLEDKDSYLVTVGGNVIDFSGKALELESTGISVVPGGDVVTGDGYALLPSDAMVVTPWGSVYRNEEIQMPGVLPDKMAVEEDGSVVLDSGVTIKPGGEVVLPDTDETVGPADNVVIIDNDGAQELPELPGDYIPSDETPGGEIPEPSQTPEETAGPSPENSGGSPSPAPSDETGPSPSPSDNGGAAPSPSGEASPTPSQQPDGTVPATPSPSPAAEEPVPVDAPDPQEDPGPDLAPEPTPEPTPAPTPEPAATPEPFGISSLRTGFSWSQESVVDLFSNRTSGQELGEKLVDDGHGNMVPTPVIAPGSAGYYDFKLQNNANYAIRFTLSISECSFHLPILYSVRDLEDNYLYQGGSKVNTDGSAISTGYILLPPHSERRYRLGWEWQYEDWLAPWEDDVYDTQAAYGDDRTYMVSLDIDAEQVYSASNR